MPSSRGRPAQKAKLSVEFRPVAEFRVNAAQFIEQVRKTCEPIILTRHGRRTAVLIDVALNTIQTFRTEPGERALW